MKASKPDKGSAPARWTLWLTGAALLLVGWAVTSVVHLGEMIFVVNSVLFVALGIYIFALAIQAPRQAIRAERRQRLELLVHNMELQHMAMRDDATRLFNRQYLFDRLERELETAKGLQRPLAFIAIEIRSLDHVSHTYGYKLGDRLLAEFGSFLLECTRATDIPASMSGNRFGVILPDTSKRGAYTMLERLIQALASLPLLEAGQLQSELDVTFGVSGYPWAGDTVDAIVREAETQPAAGESEWADQEREIARQAG